MNDTDLLEQDFLAYVKNVEAAIKSRKPVHETYHMGWQFKCFFGPAPRFENEVPSLEYTAFALTEDKEGSEKPTLLGCPQTMRVDFDERSVIMWSASTKSVLTRMIKKSFRGFSWTTKKEN